MKIVSDCFNFVTTMLSYHIKFINVLDTHVYFIYVYIGGGRTSDKISYMSPVLQWRRQNFDSEKSLSDNVLLKKISENL